METCLWCTESPESVTVFLKRYCAGDLTPQKTQDANNDFIYCSDCVAMYHQAREGVPELHKRLWELETARLLKFFREMLEVDVDQCDLYFIEDGYEQPVSDYTSEEFNNQLRYPLMEVLKYPYLLCHENLCEMVVKVLCKMEDLNNPLRLQEQYQGTYLLMVHPNEMVRRWAIDTARLLGRVDRDKYYDLQEVFSCMFYILDLGISVEMMNDSYYSGKIRILPPHLYDSNNKKSYWLGICMLLMQLGSQAMDNLLMGPPGQASIPQCIINAMTDCNEVDDPGSSPFWPALHCFLVILDRLGSKIWGKIDPLDAFLAITRAGSYIAEIKNIQQKTSGTRVKVEPENHDDLLSCSQIVYDCYATERTNRSSECSSSNSDASANTVFEEMSCLVNVLQSEMGQGMRVYGSTFLWFIPFVDSVMELPEHKSICIGEVLHYLDNNIIKDVLYGRTQTCDKVTEFFIRILVYVIELHLSKGCMGTLSRFAHIWVDMVMQCATLSVVNCNATIQPRKGLYSKRETQMPEIGVGPMSQSCKELIRSLLKEGGRKVTDPEFARFWDLINKHLRGAPAREWILPKSEYESLKKCLIRLIKAISDRPAISNDVLPCAPLTPPPDPSENVISYPNSMPLQQLQTKDAKVGSSGPVFKGEPLWEHKECEGSFCDGHEEIIKAKNEPYNFIPSSEFRPPLAVTCIKPDLGKIQEIRSRLNDDQNLSRIQAITNRRFETEDEQGKCSDLKGIGPASVVHPQPSTSQSKIPDSARLSKSSQIKLNNDDDEPLDVRRRRLKRSLKSREEDSTDARQVSIQLSSSAKEVHESSTITISDDGSNDKKPLETMVRRDRPLDLEFNTCPGRDYDDLSESQVFEFETQEDMASAWNEPHIDIPVVTKKQKLQNDSKAFTCHDAVELKETQFVSDEDIEKACLQVEAQIHQRQQPQVPRASTVQMSPKPISNEKYDFIESTHSKSPPGKTGLTDKKGRQQLSRKPPIIEAPSQTVKLHRRSYDSISQDHVKRSSSAMLASSSVSPSTAAPSRACSASSVVRSQSKPFIVPPKKVRKPVEPKSPAELLGLKKKERKAFDLSQRSLTSLGKLRSHGQSVHVEPQQKSKRTHQPKFGVKKGKKLLASQDLQYYRQSRGMLQKSAAATTAVAKSNKCPVPDTLPKSKPATEAVEEPREEEEEEDDYFFLPCSQPDPCRRMDSTVGTNEVNICLPNDSKKTKSDCFESIKSKEFSSLQNSKGAVCSMAKGSLSRDEKRVDDDDEWTYLTQNEPTDMELCSQMEEEYGENLIIAGDTDSGKQTNGSEGERSVPPKPLCGSASQKSLPDASFETTSNDHVFLKPSMPTECQKKAKPPTAKIYTSSSRSASLAREMGKVANPLPAANVAKAKVARPPPAMQPPPPKSMPHEFRQPVLPRPTLHSPNQVPESSHSNVTSACHVPSYKAYPRPERPVSKRPPVAQDRKFDLKDFDLKRAILEWDYNWFHSRMFGIPDDLCPFPLKKVPLTFSSYQEYFTIMYPLLLANTFEEMADEWTKGSKIKIDLHCKEVEYHNRIAVARFTASLDHKQVRMQLYPKEENLVLLWLPDNTGAYAEEPGSPMYSAHFGCVSESKVFSNGGQWSTLNITIETRGNVSSVNNQTVCCELIGSFVNALREFKALCFLQNTRMVRPVVKPDIISFAPCEDGLPNLDMPEYNDDQAKAVRSGVAMVKRKEKTPKILLIHGPPGTGKSKVIVGILEKLLPDCKQSSSNGNVRITRILLCAPSNAAVDHLMKKIICTFKAKSTSPQGSCGDINLVRIGVENSISEDLRGFSLDNQVKRKLEKEQQESDLDIQRKMKELDEKIDKLSDQCAATDKNSTALLNELHAEKLSCLNKREKLSKKLKELKNKQQEEQSRRLSIAHVICCTLSTSGIFRLQKASCLGHEPFDCVIVDEAGQAKETETLIPLYYQCRNLILVGDPKQLPPTVSQKAKELCYDRSLMARVCHSLDRSNTPQLPSIFLSMQYRMHPQISEFPSKYIYNNKLKTECVKSIFDSSWPFVPYEVLDVADGKERKEGDSYSNVKELNLVMKLLKLIVKQRFMHKEKILIGVITPYKAQKLLIQKALKENPIKELKSCKQPEVDTVDGFQGREMDCIIVSCVRADNRNGSIGFVHDLRRMNVTITRAKLSLFILGHVSTLKENEHWGELLKDAERRGTIIEAKESDFDRVTKKVLKWIKLSRTSSHPPTNIPNPAHPHRQTERTRPSDPRLQGAQYSSRAQDRGNQGFTHSRPSTCVASDPRRHERRHERHSFPSVSSRAYWK